VEQEPPIQSPGEPTEPGSQSFPLPSGPLPQPPGPPPYPSQPRPPSGQYSLPRAAQPRVARPQPLWRSRRALWIILVGVAAVFLLCCIGGLAVVANGGKNTSSNATTSSSPSPAATSPSGVTPTATLPANTYTIGDKVNFHNEWQITITNANFSNDAPSQFDPTPDVGKVYLIIQGTFENLTTKAQPLSTLLYFELRDAQGNSYIEAFLPSLTPPDSRAVEAGSFSQGTWGYEVPSSAQTFTLSFNADLTGSPVIWSISR